MKTSVSASKNRCTRRLISLCGKIIIALACGSVLRAAALEEKKALADVLSGYEKLVAQWQYDLGDAPFGTVITKEGRVIYEAYDNGSKEYPSSIDKGSLWPLASISKALGITLLLRLVNEGRVDLNARVSEYLEAFGTRSPLGYDRTVITIRDLAAKTVELDIAERRYDLAEEAHKYDVYYLKQPLDGRERNGGLQWEILQDIIEMAAGVDYSTLLRQKILEPMGLRSIRPVYFYDLENRALPATRSGRVQYSDKRRLMEGGLYGTVGDINAFCQRWMLRDLNFSEKLCEQALKMHCHRVLVDGTVVEMGLGAIYLYNNLDGFVISGGGLKINAITPKSGVVITLFFLPRIAEARLAGRPYLDFNDIKVSLLRLAGSIY